MKSVFFSVFKEAQNAPSTGESSPGAKHVRKASDLTAGITDINYVTGDGQHQQLAHMKKLDPFGKLGDASQTGNHLTHYTTLSQNSGSRPISGKDRLKSVMI